MLDVTHVKSHNNNQRPTTNNNQQPTTTNNDSQQPTTNNNPTLCASVAQAPQALVPANISLPPASLEP
jgi:hypothetical protein